MAATTIRKLIEQTEYKDKADCLERLFESAGIREVARRDGQKVITNLENAPAKLGAKPCGVDVYQLVDQMNQARAVKVANEPPKGRAVDKIASGVLPPPADEPGKEKK